MQSEVCEDCCTSKRSQDSETCQQHEIKDDHVATKDSKTLSTLDWLKIRLAESQIYQNVLEHQVDVFREALSYRETRLEQLAADNKNLKLKVQRLEAEVFDICQVKEKEAAQLREEIESLRMGNNYSGAKQQVRIPREKKQKSDGVEHEAKEDKAAQLRQKMVNLRMGNNETSAKQELQICRQKSKGVLQAKNSRSLDM